MYLIAKNVGQKNVGKGEGPWGIDGPQKQTQNELENKPANGITKKPR